MTYTEFKNYCMTHLWKTGDSVVLDSLDTIIRTAETELDRVFKVEERVELVTIQATSSMVALPADCKTVRHVSIPPRGEASYLTPDEYSLRKAQGRLRPGDYSVINRTIALDGNVVSTSPVDLEVWYYKKVLHFQDTPSGHWMVDDFFDVYLYCVLKHTAPFLREDERLQTWNNLFQAAYGSAMDENDDKKFAGSPLRMKRDQSIR